MNVEWAQYTVGLHPRCQQEADNEFSLPLDATVDSSKPLVSVRARGLRHHPLSCLIVVLGTESGVSDVLSKCLTTVMYHHPSFSFLFGVSPSSQQALDLIM